MKFSLNSNFSQSKVASNTTFSVFYGLSFAKCKLMGLLAFCTYKPNFLAKLELMKECIAIVSIRHERSLPQICASRYKRLGLGLRPLALATNSPSNN
jgi:hypothetical protein